MPTEYNGTETGSHPPSATPAFNHTVKVNLPADGDPASASTLNQPAQVLADWVDFLRHRLSFDRGVNTWTIDWAYVAGDVVVDDDDHRIYRCVTGNTGLRPSNNSALGEEWARCDYSFTEIQALGADLNYGYSGITCSNGASANPATLLKFFSDAFRVIFVQIQSVPFDSSSTVDFTGSAAKFGSMCLGGLVSMNSGGYSYGGQVGVQPNVGGDKNVCTIWAKKGNGDPGSACTVSLILFGA